MNNFYHVEKNDYEVTSDDEVSEVTSDEIVNDEVGEITSDEIVNDEVGEITSDEVTNSEIVGDKISDISSEQINEEPVKKNRKRNLTPPRKNRNHNSSFLGFKHIFMGVIISLIMLQFPNFAFSFCVTISINVVYKQFIFEMHIENSILRVCGDIIPFIMLSNFAGVSLATIVIYRKPILKFLC